MIHEYANDGVGKMWLGDDIALQINTLAPSWFRGW